MFMRLILGHILQIIILDKNGSISGDFYGEFPKIGSLIFSSTLDLRRRLKLVSAQVKLVYVTVSVRVQRFNLAFAFWLWLKPKRVSF